MKNRDNKASDFGLTNDKIRQICKRCKHLDPPDQDLLYAVAREECPPGVADFVAVSLLSGISYDVAYQRNPIPLNRNDFYSYRRRVAAVFYRRQIVYKRKN